MPKFSLKNRLIILLIVFFLLIDARSVWAFGIGENIDCKAIGLISPSRAIKCMFAEYGITEEMVKENVKYLDVANYKYPYPQVTLTFSPTDPKPGEKVTASVTPTNFGNPPDMLYYTWYLQKKDCVLNPPLRKNYDNPEDDPEDWDNFNPDLYLPGKRESDGRILDDLCNVNKDYLDGDSNKGGIVDIEDYKVAAARIYAGNGFEFETTTYKNTADSDSDGYEAILGGADQKGKKDEQCFFRDVKAGKDYAFSECFHLFPNHTNASGSILNETGASDDGNASFKEAEEKFWHTNPNDSDTAQTGQVDEANVVGLAAKDFTWTYQADDKIGVAVEGVSTGPTMLKDATYKIMWAIPGGTCEALDDPETFIDTDLLADLEYDDNNDAVLDPYTWPDCPDGCEFTRMVVKRKLLSQEQAPLSSYTFDNYEYFVKTEVISLPSRRRVEGAGESTADSSTETVEDPDGTVTTTTDNSANTTLEVGTTTFPFVYPNDSWDPNCNEVDTASLVSSGFFTQEEVDSDEKYQVALSNNGSCCDSAYIIVDEEGNDDPNDESTWTDNTAICTTISSKIEIVNSEDINTNTIFTLDQNKFNKLCLTKNLVSPTGAGENEKIEVSLSYSPDNPVNDTSVEGDNADWINVVSTIENSTKNESLNYTWSVYAGQYADPDATWTSLSKIQLVGVEQTTGAGIPNLKFKANFTSETPDGSSTNVPKYLKVKLNVSEKIAATDSEGTRKGNAEVIIPLSSFNNKLSVFNTLVDSSTLKLFPADNIKGICANFTNAEGQPIDPATCEEICKIAAGSEGELVDAAVCQVAPDEIVAVEADIKPEPENDETLGTFDFLWTLNGQNLSYKYAGEDFTEPGKLIYFPVLAAKGSTLNLSLTATSQISGRKISLAKTFLVSEPTFKVISSDEETSKPKTLGYYKDLDDDTKQYPDYSQTEFLALKDSSVKLDLAQFASFPLPTEDDLPIKWYWNDTQLADKGYSLPAFPTTGLDSSFSLKAEGVYTQDNNTKKALRDYWEVSLDEYYEQLFSQTIDFTLADSIDGSTVSQNSQGKILASFISSVPAYFAFLFRLVMTAFVLLAAIWILFALFPQAQNND